MQKYLYNTGYSKQKLEYEFTKQLCQIENANLIIAWIKSRDIGFYTIEYSVRIANHQKQRSFNPDYFICCNYKNIDYILIFEIKADGDNSEENKAKYKYAIKHFAELNA